MKQSEEIISKLLNIIIDEHKYFTPKQQKHISIKLKNIIDEENKIDNRKDE